MLRPLTFSLLSLLLVLGTPHAPVDAQGVSPFAKRGGLKTSEADQKMINKTRDELLAAKGGEATRRWSNPKNGSSGVTTLVQTFTKQGLPCREIRYDIDVGGKKRRYNVPYCQVADGSWKIAF